MVAKGLVRVAGMDVNLQIRAGVCMHHSSTRTSTSMYVVCKCDWAELKKQR